MQARSERFEMRLDQMILERVDSWRANQSDLPSRAEAVRRLMESGLTKPAASQPKFSDGEKLILIMLCEISKALKLKTDIDPKLVEAAIHGGHLWGLKWEYTGVFHDHEDDERIVSEVGDILDMWFFLESGYAKLSKKDKERISVEAKPFGDHVIFSGFDGNYETQHLGIAQFLIRDLDRFTNFKGRDLNSHCPLVPTYRRMLPVFEPIRRNIMRGELGADQIIRILKAEHS